ncbi:MAG: hypothetical protein HZB26_12970 [Candidatus Hydrogenedentes bacterium]|nr:hypothetical protein [Candidatus Hydrogenedentota bacterium]
MWYANELTEALSRLPHVRINARAAIFGICLTSVLSVTSAGNPLCDAVKAGQLETLKSLGACEYVGAFEYRVCAPQNTCVEKGSIRWISANGQLYGKQVSHLDGAWRYAADPEGPMDDYHDYVVVNGDYAAFWRQGGPRKQRTAPSVTVMQVCDHKSSMEMGQLAHLRLGAFRVDPLLGALGTGKVPLTRLLSPPLGSASRSDAHEGQLPSGAIGIVVEVSGSKGLYGRFFVNPRKGFMCESVEIHGNDGTVVRNRIDLKETSPGVWFPDRVESRTETLGTGGVDDGYTFTLESVSIRQHVDPLQFTVAAIAYPSGVNSMGDKISVQHVLLDGTSRTDVIQGSELVPWTPKAMPPKR